MRHGIIQWFSTSGSQPKSEYRSVQSWGEGKIARFNLGMGI